MQEEEYEEYMDFYRRKDSFSFQEGEDLFYALNYDYYDIELAENFIDDIDDRTIILNNYYSDYKEIFLGQSREHITKTFRLKHWREPYTEDELMNYFLTGEYKEDCYSGRMLYRMADKMGIEGVSKNTILVSEYDDKLLKKWEGKIQRVGEYKGVSNLIVLKCNECGSFVAQTGTNSLQTFGCSSCKEKMDTRSFGESLIKKVLKENNIHFIQEFSDGLRNPKTGRELRYDFVIPNGVGRKTVYVEIQGEQHYKAVEFFGGDKVFENQVYKDSIKRAYAEDKGIFVELDYREHSIELLKQRVEENLFGILRINKGDN